MQLSFWHVFEQSKEFKAFCHDKWMTAAQRGNMMYIENWPTEDAARLYLQVFPPEFEVKLYHQGNEIMSHCVD